MNSKAESHLSDPAKEHLISDVATITIRNTRNIRNIRTIKNTGVILLLARRFAPLFLSLSRLSWLMVASLGAISFSLSFNGRVNGSINLPVVVNGAKILSVRYFL